MPKRSSKMPTDVNQLAQAVVEQATVLHSDFIADSQPTSGKNPAAVALGRLGGLKGGKARAERLSATDDIGQSRIRWSGKTEVDDRHVLRNQPIDCLDKRCRGCGGNAMTVGSKDACRDDRGPAPAENFGQHGTVRVVRR